MRRTALLLFVGLAPLRAQVDATSVVRAVVEANKKAFDAGISADAEMSNPRGDREALRFRLRLQYKRDRLRLEGDATAASVLGFGFEEPFTMFLVENESIAFLPNRNLYARDRSSENSGVAVGLEGAFLLTDIDNFEIDRATFEREETLTREGVPVHCRVLDIPVHRTPGMQPFVSRWWVATDTAALWRVENSAVDDPKPLVIDYIRLSRAPLDDATFSFTPPPDAVRVDWLGLRRNQ